MNNQWQLGFARSGDVVPQPLCLFLGKVFTIIVIKTRFTDIDAAELAKRIRETRRRALMGLL